jgi:hypothetical protein
MLSPTTNALRIMELEGLPVPKLPRGQADDEPVLGQWK